MTGQTVKAIKVSHGDRQNSDEPDSVAVVLISAEGRPRIQEVPPTAESPTVRFVPGKDLILLSWIQKLETAEDPPEDGSAWQIVDQTRNSARVGSNDVST